MTTTPTTNRPEEVTKMTTTHQPRYGDDGTLLTSCCGSYSTFDDNGGLMCKGCHRAVPFGEGDGSITRADR